MPFAFRHQPLKAVYLAGSVLLLFVRLLVSRGQSIQFIQPPQAPDILV
ncbi:hypothetical protein EVJ58_g608 [Rhodofomes roseus]|uniref:Uncharacterized protein n=1 Tax=Rhodofomes roseus TaxID=34475 RepID=A0A4Y9Z395_9APHY|nr:hypothetical protein EVJ58_g608 [Rhodofomes roseus]